MIDWADFERTATAWSLGSARFVLVLKDASTPACTSSDATVDFPLPVAQDGIQPETDTRTYNGHQWEIAQINNYTAVEDFNDRTKGIGANRQSFGQGRPGIFGELLEAE